MLLSMPLAGFDVNWFGEEQVWRGGFLWLMSAMSPFGGGNFHILMLVYSIVAVFNIPQLIFPFIHDPKKGTSLIWIWSFSVAAFIIIPFMAFSMVFSVPKTNAFREGYFIYQAGYIISAIGFHLKRKEYLESETAIHP
jgi:hypothetical protein